MYENAIDRQSLKIVDTICGGGHEHYAYSLLKRFIYPFLILASLNTTCPIKTQRARDLIDSARKGLVKERIRQNSQKIKFLKDEILLWSQKLALALPSDIYSHVNDVIERSRKRMFTKSKLGRRNCNLCWRKR